VAFLRRRIRALGRDRAKDVSPEVKTKIEDAVRALAITRDTLAMVDTMRHDQRTNRATTVEGAALA
jgi:hypothetical protein